MYSDEFHDVFVSVEASMLDTFLVSERCD